MTKFSRHQQTIIKNYYKNRESISLQKLQENVSELYLTEGKKRQQIWKRIEGHLAKLGLPPARVQHLIKQDDPALIAKVVEEVMSKDG